ncbi:BamA/TamA family outer membrane protein [soil metagenome]
MGFSKLAAQDKRPLIIISSGQNKDVVHKFIDKKSEYDSITAIQAAQQLINKLHSEGYLTAGFDSIVFDTGEVKAFLWTGDEYQWAVLRPGNLDVDLLARTGYRSRYFNEKKFRPQEVTKLFENIIKYSDNNGYPFASVKLDSIEINHSYISASLNYDRGPFISFDSIQVSGNSRVKSRYLSAYLKILHGQPFEEDRVLQISQRLKRLPYLQLNENPFVTFQNSEGSVYLDINDKKVNQIDGIIGFLPNEGNNNLLITGQFNLLLQNLFGTGKELNMEWQRIKPLSQLLNLAYFHPNILHSPLNVGTSFHLLKEDTTFINRDLSLKLILNKGRFSDIKFFTNIRSANLLSTSQYRRIEYLPDYADFTLSTYGVGYQWSNLNDFIFPTRGFHFEIDGSVGNKKIKRNIGLPQELYYGIPEKSLQYSMTAALSNSLELRRNIVFMGKLQAGMVENEKLFLNDLFRLGGLRSLRGFNENFFFASHFATATLETRLLFEEQSYFFVFLDQGWLKYNLTNIDFQDTPTGVGIGLNLTLEGGIFNFVYALGNSKLQPIGFQTSKIHLGYISRF